MKKIIITFSLLLICSLSFSQNKKKVEDIKLEIIELRKQNKELQNELKQEKQKNSDKYNSINTINSNNNSRIDRLEKEMKENSNHWLLSLFSFWGTFGGIIGLLLGLIGVKKYIKERTDKIAVKKIADLTDLNTETIKRVYQTEDERKLLRDKAKILIVNEKNTDLDNSIEKIFIKGSEKSKFNCKKIDIVNLKDSNIEFNDYDLVIVDNSKPKSNEIRNWISKDILSFSKKCLEKNIAIYYFSEDIFFPTKDDEFKNLNNKHILAYGNAHANIYNNVMNVLQIKFLFNDK